jgi:hypothetical protein
MTNTTENYQNDFTCQKEVDETVAGGWDEVIKRVQLTSVRMLEIAANIYAHRKPAMDIAMRRDYGLLGINLGIHISDFTYFVSGFRPPKRSELELTQSKFSSPFESVRAKFPSAELLKSHIEAIDLAVCTTVDAVSVLSERPGMPIPTFDQLATAYIELARLQGLEDAVETAASVNLTGGSHADRNLDLFGVGSVLAPTINRIIPPRCVPGQAKITLPKQATIDDIIAAHLLERFVMNEDYIYFESQTEDSFDAATTHAKNHATISVGTTPFHSPKALSFDRKAFEHAITNSELVIKQAIHQGIPMDFTDEIVRFAEGDKAGDFRFETDMINSFFEVCETSLAMRATNLLLKQRFETSEAYQDWCRKRFNERLANNAEYQKFKPKLDKPLTPFGLSIPLTE